MIANDIFDRLRRATDKVSRMDIDYELEEGSRSRLHDNVGASVVDDLATMLRTNPEFRKWYVGLQDAERRETDIDKKRRLELMLMYPFKYYQSTVKGKVKSDWEGRSGTSRDSSFDPSKHGEFENDVHYSDLGHGNLSSQYLSDRQREEIFRNKTPGSSAYKYTLESTGKYGTAHEQNPADNVMTSQFITKLIREVNKHYDKKIMTVLCALMLRWGINIPTYINRRDVPKVWWEMVSYAHKNGGIYNSTKNLRSFLSNFGVKDFRESSFQMRELRNIMMRITDSKSVDEVFRTLTSPQANNNYGDAGKAKNYFDIDVTARRFGELNESLKSLEDILESVFKSSFSESPDTDLERLVGTLLVNLPVLEEIQ